MTQTREQHSAVWRKSSYSGYNGNCVEVATWRKSGPSGSDGERIGVAAAFEGAAPEITIRDSKNPAGPRLGFPASAWRTFAANLK
jgi:hypothetical protein